MNLLCKDAQHGLMTNAARSYDQRDVALCSEVEAARGWSKRLCMLYDDFLELKHQGEVCTGDKGDKG